MPDEPPIDQAAIGTHASDPEPQAKAAPGPEVQGIETAPATVDENLDLEATISESVPLEPAKTPDARPLADKSLETTMVESPIEVPLPSGAATEFEDDLFATIVAAPEPRTISQSSAGESTASRSVFTPPPGLAPSADDANATLAAEEPLPRSSESPVPATTAPAAPTPGIPQEIPRNLDQSVTLPSADRQAPAPASHPAPIPPPVPAVPSAPIAPAAAPLAAAPQGGFRWWWIFGPIGFVVIALVGANLGRQQPAVSEPIPTAATPLPEPEPAVAPPMPGVAAATPSPTPVPPAGEPVTASELERFTATERITQPLFLTGTYRVSTSTPAAGTQPGSAVMRPSDTAISAKIRVMTLFPSGAPVPSEGSTISIDSESRYLIKEVRRGADGQINVRVEQK